jgi:hypothetical protein
VSDSHVDAVRERHTERLMALPQVVGVGVGRIDDQPVLEVLVDSGVPAAEPIPASLDGVPVHVRDIGTPTAQADD